MVAAFCVAVLLFVALGGIWLGAAVVARHRAQAGADLAALAAAAQLVSGPAGACRKAAEVAEAAAGLLKRCDVDGLDVLVTVSVGTDRVLGGRAWATGIPCMSARESVPVVTPGSRRDTSSACGVLRLTPEPTPVCGARSPRRSPS